MPLHLLGKKSWNVYNADNIARVRRDEAAAKVAEEAEEQRMQEIDAQRRLAILRGEAPPPIEDAEPAQDQQPPAGSLPGASHPGSMRRKRKRPDEDDTEFELRIAREKNELVVTSLEPERKATSSAPIVDHAGHIDIFGDAKLRAHAEKNEEAEKEAKKKKQRFEDQYTMRFSNAAGRDGISSPWYSQSNPNEQEAPMKNVWGRDDPQRKERDTKRIVASDPLAMMRQGASKIRELKKERKQFQEEQAVQLKQLRREERHREKRGRRHEEREGKREKDGSSRRSDHRHRSRETRHRDQDREEPRSRSTRHDRDDSKDRRRRRNAEENMTNDTEGEIPGRLRETTERDIGDTDLEIEAVNSLLDTP
ncbi:hypothetical protein G7Z17_g2872 [Cylindrodendrum hubeiense]|uniref:CBF1-interacting co-repressor CIR N-terminal domain-containing protein n=1 Tax=Cylindrodendrum hubeiense TaxID=595255 RepID=A0A9P5HFU2_9HYPO|nr:hypothetical protein G7Z17_g2872 [Cylindrodendrum hubeiense]